jgi:ferredoxin
LRDVDCLIRFLPSERTVRVPPGTSLLEAACQAALPIAQACTGVGSCARCGVRIVAVAGGLPVETAAEKDAKQRNRIDAKLRLACLLEVECDLTVTAPYW